MRQKRAKRIARGRVIMRYILHKWEVNLALFPACTVLDNITVRIMRHFSLYRRQFAAYSIRASD